MTTRICAIVAMAENRVIGNDGGIPWHISSDMKYFKEKTMGHAVFMGRKTYDSFPPKVKPLPGRKNIVLTRNTEWEFPEGVLRVHDAPGFFHRVRDGSVLQDEEILWVIGGQSLYEMSLPFLDELYVTRVPMQPDGDTFFPEFEKDFTLESEIQSDECVFCRYVRDGAKA